MVPAFDNYNKLIVHVWNFNTEHFLSSPAVIISEIGENKQTYRHIFQSLLDRTWQPLQLLGDEAGWSQNLR